MRQRITFLAPNGEPITHEADQLVAIGTTPGDEDFWLRVDCDAPARGSMLERAMRQAGLTPSLMLLASASADALKDLKRHDDGTPAPLDMKLRTLQNFFLYITMSLADDDDDT